MDEQNSGPLEAKDKMAPAVSSIGTDNEGAGTSEDLAREHGLDPGGHITFLDTEDYLPPPHSRAGNFEFS